MPVKDLVRHFESSSSLSPEAPRTPVRARRHSVQPDESPSNNPPRSDPSPSPAQFLHHPLLKRQSVPSLQMTAGEDLPKSPPRKVVVLRRSHMEKAVDSPELVVPLSEAQRLPVFKEESQIDLARLSLSRATPIPEPSSSEASVHTSEEDSAPKRTEESARKRACVLMLPTSHTSHDMPRETNSILKMNVPADYGPVPSVARSIVQSVSNKVEQSLTPLSRFHIAADGSKSNSAMSHGMSMSTSSTSRPVAISTPTPGNGSQRLSYHASVLGNDPPAYTASGKATLTQQPSGLSSKTRFVEPTNDIPLSTFSHPTYAYNDITNLRPVSPSATLVSHPLSSSHVPIAAKTVFSRGSPPLLLPALDDYLCSIRPPKFSTFPSPSTSGKHLDGTLFPPMGQLAITGLSIIDLEKNTTVPPWWRSRGSLFGSFLNLLVGVLGSSAIASYYSLEGLYDGFQIFALLLNTFVPNAGRDLGGKWRKLFLGTIPNVLALNLGYTLLESFILLIVLMVVCGLLLYFFYVSTTRISRASFREGLQGKDAGACWAIVFVTFILTLIYLPLSTIAVHALLWSQDFWVVPDPYVNSTTPNPPPLGPSSEFRDPLDFCYTTTMNKNEINFAPVVVILAALTFVFLTLWFPYRLAMAIKGAVPQTDRFTELGKPRGQVELDHEYERLLDRDKNPFNFIYKDLRRGWGTYKSSYLFVKLSTLLIVAILDSDNCLFRNVNRSTVSIVRQSILVAAMSTFLALQSFLAPFLDPVNNASEWISRAGYVAFAVLGLAGALNLPINVKNALNGPILYIIYIINYGFTFYFLFINLSWTHGFVKKLSRRIDFSIDIFSPHLDISNKSRHTRRRIWQESISVLLLTSPECAIPKSQKMDFSEADDSQYPPYLLGFQGTPAERHVENLKILREVGGLEYARGIAICTGPHSHRLDYVRERIQRHFVGPDSYWRTSSRSGDRSGCFGNAWWIPFPPTLVMKYDSGELAVLNRLRELEEYVYQNESPTIQEKRNIRMALRALDGQVVVWPYTHTELLGSRYIWCWGHRYKAHTSMKFEACVLSIRRHGSLPWNKIQLGSGFDIQLTYARNVQVDGDVIGVGDDFDLTPQLAQFLAMNRDLIHDHLPLIESTITDYRRRTRRTARAKAEALTYQSLSTVYCSPKQPHLLAKVISDEEKDLRTRQTFIEHEDALIAANERMDFVNQSEASAWWYLYWDDLWRRNHDTIKALETHASDFDPHYSTSIAYRLLPRAVLETFLAQRGLFNKNGKRSDIMHSGVLNKLYFRLNQIVFRGSEKAIQYHLGNDSFEVDLEDLEFSSHAKSSTLGTGGGTDHDDVSIRARPMYRWESIFDDPLRDTADPRYRRWLPKLAVWFGLSPFWRSKTALTSGVSLDVRLEDGNYVLLDSAVEELKEKVT